MLADISAFEAIASGQAVSIIGGNAIFNSELAPLLEQYTSVKKNTERCDGILASLQDAEDTALLVGKVADAQGQFEKQLSSIRQRIGKEAGNGLDEADRKAFVKTTPESKSDFQDLMRNDPVLRYANGAISDTNIFNSPDPHQQRAEFNRLLTEFAETARGELQERINTLSDQTGTHEFGRIVGAALRTAVGSLQALTPARSEMPKLEATLKKMSDTIHAAEVVAQRPKLELSRTKEAGEKLKHLF
jgi:hypothetical protein